MVYNRRWSLCWRRHGNENADLEKGQQLRDQLHDLEEEVEDNKEKDPQEVSIKNIDGMNIEEYAASPRLPGKSPSSAVNPLTELPTETSPSETEPSSESSSESGEESGRKAFKVRKWPTQWYWQFLVLLVRTFRQSRHIILSKLNLIQTVVLTIVASVIWFQLPNTESSIADRYGYVSVE